MARKWDEKTFETELRAVATTLGHFPSNSELQGMRRYDLACQIYRRGGFITWAKRLGIARLTSDSDTGWEGEDAAAKRLMSLGFAVSRLAE